MIIDACALKTNLEIYTSKNHSLTREREGRVLDVYFHTRDITITHKITHTHNHILVTQH